MINILTGESVSKEMLNALKQLGQGKNVSKETIDNLKEIKEAYSCISQSTSTHLLVNRKGIRNGVLSRLQNMGSAVIDCNGAVSFSGKIKHEKRMDIIIGLPAAGKSSALAEPISEICESRLVDSDEAKKLLPEYNGGWGAEVVHKESQIISDNQLRTSVLEGENIVYPRVGGDCEELKDYIIEAKNHDYKVYIHFNDHDKNKALGRMINRFLETGRFIKPELITKYGNSIENTYQTLKSSSIIDGYSKWSNDVPLGHRPQLIECSDSCKALCTVLKEKRTAAERLEESRDINKILSEKINEVNEILKRNPKLSAEYFKARDELRQKKAELSEKNDRAATEAHKNPTKNKR